MSTHPDQSVVERMACECLAARVRILNRAITGLYDDALRPFGVKISQMNILVVAAKLGVARPGRICEILHMDASTLSRNAERMLAQGWLEVLPGVDAHPAAAGHESGHEASEADRPRVGRGSGQGAHASGRLRRPSALVVGTQAGR